MGKPTEAIPIGRSGTNAAFLPGVSEDIITFVRYAMTYHHEAERVLPSGRRWTVYVTDFQERIGVGTSMGADSNQDCTKMAIFSPASIQYGHPVPAVDEWVADQLHLKEHPLCRICGTDTIIGVVICPTCMARAEGSWRKWIDPNFIQDIVAEVESE